MLLLVNFLKWSVPNRLGEHSDCINWFWLPSLLNLLNTPTINESHALHELYSLNDWFVPLFQLHIFSLI